MVSYFKFVSWYDVIQSFVKVNCDICVSCDRHADADMLRYGKVACIVDSRQMKEKRALEKAVVAYRQQYQHPEDRREYDLNDPSRIKKVEQSDAQMMPPGLVGEDPESKIRQQNQREQLREWLTQQQTEQAAERHQQELEGGFCLKTMLYTHAQFKHKSQAHVIVSTEIFRAALWPKQSRNGQQSCATSEPWDRKEKGSCHRH